MTKTLFDNLAKNHETTIQAQKERLDKKRYGLSPVVYERRMKLENGEVVTKQFRVDWVKPTRRAENIARFGYQYFRYPLWLLDENPYYLFPFISIVDTIKEEPLPTKYTIYKDAALVDIPSVMLEPIPLMYTILYRNSRMRMLLTYGIGTAMADPYLYNIYGARKVKNPYKEIGYKFRKYPYGTMCVLSYTEAKVFAKSESEILSRGLLKSEVIYKGQPYTFKQMHSEVEHHAIVNYWGSYRWRQSMMEMGYGRIGGFNHDDLYKR